jgi:hypothetical protein
MLCHRGLYIRQAFLAASCLLCAVAATPAVAYEKTVSVPRIPPSSATQPISFPVFAGANQFFWDYIYYNAPCTSAGVGTFTPLVAPKEGTLFFSTQKRLFPTDGDCPGVKFPASVASYTWSGSGANSDNFELQWISPDGDITEDTYWSPQLALTSTSFYIYAGKRHGLTLNAWMMQQGALAAAVAASEGTGTGVVILDFGNPKIKSGAYGTDGFLKNGFLNTTQIESAVANFADGYYTISGGTTSVTLVVGTNTHFDASFDVSSIGTHALYWVSMVDDLIEKLQKDVGISVLGGIDAEVAFGPPTLARAWVAGYRQGNFELTDFGDAAGCPESGTTASPKYCSGGDGDWTQDDIYNVAREYAGSLPLPEIYGEQGGNAKEWQQMSLYSQLAYGLPFLIVSPLTQHGACSVRKCMPKTDNTPEQGWYQLWNDFDADARTTIYSPSSGYSTDMTWRP